MAPQSQEISDRYATMGIDDLIRVAVDRDALTPTGRQALAEELRKRGLDNPDAIREYEHERDQQIKQEEDLVAARRWSNRPRIQRGFDYLKQHPLLALLASAISPGLAFLIGYAMVSLRVGNGRVLSCLVSLMLALGGVCGIAAARSSTGLAIRILGGMAALGEFFYAFVFLFAATIGFR